MFRCLIPLAVTLAPLSAAAHPHVFVEAQVTAVFDGAGRFVGVRLDWTYDEFFTLMLTSEIGADPDGDMVLTDDELAALSASVLDWPADYAGDLEIRQDGVLLTLGDRADPRIRVDQGRITESHFRPLAEPVDATVPVAIQVFDPFYYVAYSVVGEIGIENGPGCAATYQAADLDQAYALVDELLYGRPASDVGPDEAFPEVGQAFADTVTVRCDG